MLTLVYSCIYISIPLYNGASSMKYSCRLVGGKPSRGKGAGEFLLRGATSIESKVVAAPISSIASSFSSESFRLKMSSCCFCRSSLLELVIEMKLSESGSSAAVIQPVTTQYS